MANLIFSKDMFAKDETLGPYPPQGPHIDSVDILSIHGYLGGKMESVGCCHGPRRPTTGV